MLTFGSVISEKHRVFSLTPVIFNLSSVCLSTAKALMLLLGQFKILWKLVRKVLGFLPQKSF